MSEWMDTELSAVAEIKISNVDKKSKPGELPVLLCNYMDVYSNDYIRADIAFMESTASSVEIEKFKVLKNDVLITKDSETPFDIGIPAVIYDEIDGLVCGYHLALLRPKADVANPAFLSKVLGSHSTQAYFARVAAGSTRYGLSNGAIAKTPVRLPSIERQTKIANILRTIDETIEQTEALIKKYSLVKAGMMHDLFARGLAPDGKLRPARKEAPDLYKETPIGWFPKEWDAPEVATLIDRIEQGWSPDCEADPASPTEWGVLKTTSVTWNGFNRGANKTLPNHLVPRLQYKIKEGDLLVTRAGPNSRVGVVAVVESDPGLVLLSDKLYRLVPQKGVSSKFLSLALSSQITQRFLDGFKTGLAESQTNISQSIIRRLVVVQPKSHEQEEIVARVDASNRGLTQLKRELQKLKLQKSGLMHDLLTGEVSVTVNDTEAAHV